MFPQKTGFVPFFGVLGGGIIPHNGLSRQFVKKDNTLFVNILSEYRFVVYIILGVRDAFCGARGWQCARVAWLGVLIIYIARWRRCMRRKNRPRRTAPKAQARRFGHGRRDESATPRGTEWRKRAGSAMGDAMNRRRRSAANGASAQVRPWETR